MFKVCTKKRTGEDSPGKATQMGLDEEKVRGERPGKDTRAWLAKKQTGWTWTGQGPWMDARDAKQGDYSSSFVERELLLPVVVKTCEESHWKARVLESYH
ncbi:hypothetical protein Bca4012_037673 [Brassica carinata]